MHIVSYITDIFTIINWNHYQNRYFGRMDSFLGCKYQFFMSDYTHFKTNKFNSANTNTVKHQVYYEFFTNGWETVPINGSKLWSSRRMNKYISRKSFNADKGSFLSFICHFSLSHFSHFSLFNSHRNFSVLYSNLPFSHIVSSFCPLFFFLSFKNSRSFPYFVCHTWHVTRSHPMSFF